MRTVVFAVVASACLSVSCNDSGRKDVDQVPVGSEVQVTRQDGGLVEGTLSGKDETAVRVSNGPTTRSVPRKEIAEVRVPAPAPVPESAAPAPAGERARVTRPEPPPRATFREVTVPAATKIS